MFHLLQTVSEHTIDLDVGVPARGLHGEAYRGHIFWDELFVFPFLNLRFPELTRALLRYRVRRLPEARQAARAAGYRGAMYPWQSGSDGREETQRLHLNPRSGRWLPDNSHRQRHVNAAVAWNVWQYYQATGDLDFLAAYGAEMLLEIARFWASIATYNRALDRYEICGVMGPDEYHDGYPDRDEPGLDNNAYTNVMAAGSCAGRWRPWSCCPTTAAPSWPSGSGWPARSWSAGRRSAASCASPSTTATSSASSRATATWKSWTGTAPAPPRRHPPARPASWRPRATPPTATRPPSRPTC